MGSKIRRSTQNLDSTCGGGQPNSPGSCKKTAFPHVLGPGLQDKGLRYGVRRRRSVRYCTADRPLLAAAMATAESTPGGTGTGTGTPATVTFVVVLLGCWARHGKATTPWISQRQRLVRLGPGEGGKKRRCRG